MSATLLPNAKQTFTGPNGAPLSGGSVYFYIPNTTTPKNTWQDSAQTILNTNPVVLDANGQAVIWGSGTYRQVVYDANNNLIWDQITEDVSGGLIGNFTDAIYNAGTDFTPGTTTTLTLPIGPGSATNTWVFFDAAYQTDSTYTINGTTLTFTGPIPVGVGVVTVKIGSTVSIGTPGAGTVTDASIASNAAIQASKIQYAATATGTISRTAQSKMADVADLRDYGVDLTGVNDSTTEFQNALNEGGVVNFPAGTIAVTSLKWAKDNTFLRGSGRGTSIVKFTAAGTSGLSSSLQGTAQRFYCRASDVQFLDDGGLGRVIDLTDMMFCQLERCFTFGFGAASSIGVYMGSTNGTLQCTYNRIQDHYNGNTQYGLYMHDGANANIIDGGRFQSPVSGAIGVLLAPSGPNLVNGNTMIQPGIEQPGNTMVGIQLNGNTGGTTIVSPRLESLLNGVVVSSSDIGVALVNPIYSGCTNNLVDASAGKAFQNGTSAGVGGPSAQFNYNGVTGTTNKSVNCTVSRAAAGQYNITGLPFSVASFSVSATASTPIMDVTIIDSSTVNIFTYNSSFVATDAIISGVFFE